MIERLEKLKDEKTQISLGLLALKVVLRPLCGALFWGLTLGNLIVASENMAVAALLTSFF